ncbi:MAG: molybdopterin-dependent oxidoreductase, partial [Nitrospinota bacterium]
MRPEDVKTVIPDGLIKSCCHLCHCCCEVVVTVGDGAVKKIEGDPSSPHSRGMLCSKGLASRQLLYHPERLTRPLMRVGERGEGRWREASWEEALGTIAERLLEIRERYGPQAVAFGQGTDRGWFNVFVRLANSFGSPNWGEPGMAQCFYPRATASALTFGTELMECPSYEKTRCMLLWGIKPSATWAQKASYMMDARARGARLIVVDPRFIPMAAKADIWLRPRPGTDCALALGMLNVILEEGLYERDFIERWTIGFEELRARAGEYPLAKVETITWVPAEKIRAAARLFAENKPACITQCLALDQNIDTIQTSRAINLLTALTGNVDIPGGNVMDMFVGSGYPDIWRQNFERRDAISEEMWEKRLGAREYPLLSGREAILAPGAHMPTVWEAMLAGKPYPIKAMVIHGSNTVVSFAHSQRVREALLTLDFISVAECFMTETTSLADVVLPAGTWLEWDS